MKLPEIQQKAEELGLQSFLAPEKDGWIFENVLGFVKPSNILEIGFFRGGSALIMLSLREQALLTSVDPVFNVTDQLLGNSRESGHHDGEYECIEIIKRSFPDRFTFIEKRSQDVFPDLQDKVFDFMFIDGDHWEDGARTDFQLALDLKVPHVLVDDWIQPQNSPKATPTVFCEEFQDKFKVKAAFYREDTCQGKHIPMVLLENLNK